MLQMATTPGPHRPDGVNILLWLSGLSAKREGASPIVERPAPNALSVDLST